MDNQKIEELNSSAKIVTLNDNIFKNYVFNGYDMNERQIAGKYYHTLRVAQFAEELARATGLDVKLGRDIGLLHDYARFYQWTEYKSFNDRNTIDHGDLAVKMLFEDDEIKNFDVAEKDYKFIKYAIKFHNKKFIDREYILKNEPDMSGQDFDKMILCCEIARDADKLDLLKRIAVGDIGNNFTLSGYTPSTLASLENATYVNLEDMHTALDRIFSFIGFLFDINLAESFRIADLDEYFDGINKHYGSALNIEDYMTLQNVMKNAREKIEEKKKKMQIAL